MEKDIKKVPAEADTIRANAHTEYCNKDYNTILLQLKPNSKKFMVLTHLIKYGHITVREMSERYNSNSPRDIIYFLRKLGVPITSTEEVNPNTKRKFIIYELEEKEND